MKKMTFKELEKAYARASLFGLGDECDEILAEMDRREAMVNEIEERLNRK